MEGRQSIQLAEPVDAIMYSSKDGIAFWRGDGVETTESCHDVVLTKKEVARKISEGKWKETDTIIETSGVFFNIDTFNIADKAKMYTAKYCECKNCKKRNAQDITDTKNS